ncbi:MAG: NUDIX domain-containing protein [Candidatus Thorarchaeota archaeon]|jgi:ADP-ribose pyrophosphatase YjhB (NUDIX family)
MMKIVTSAITILRCKGKFLFLKRRKPPYENLWALVGGKVEIGEHVPTAAIREVKEETSAPVVNDYKLRGIVSERLISQTGELVTHFIIFVSEASIDTFHKDQDEGTLSLFSIEDLEKNRDLILPSDYEMFFRFSSMNHDLLEYHEAELVQDNGKYTLSYYREGMK